MLNYVQHSESIRNLSGGTCVLSLVPVNTLQIFNLLLAAPQHTAYI